MNITQLKPNPRIPRLAPGYNVKVHFKIVEGDKSRIQVFQGVVIKEGGDGINASFTVRRVTAGVGVERTFPLYSPLIDKVEIVRHGKVRRARLFYLRGLSGKAARIKEKRVELEKEFGEALATEEEVPEEVAAPEAAAPVAAQETTAAKAEAKVEAPKAEAPKAEAKKPEAKVEEPKAEKPKAEQPKAEKPADEKAPEKKE